MVQAAGSVRHYRVESRERVSFYGGWGRALNFILNIDFHNHMQRAHNARRVYQRDVYRHRISFLEFLNYIRIITVDGPLDSLRLTVTARKRGH